MSANKTIKQIHQQYLKDHNKTRINYQENPPFGKSRSFTLFDHTEVSEGGWLCGKWMTAKLLLAAEDRWGKHSYTTRADTYLKQRFSVEVDIEKLKQIHREYDLSAGCAQCGGCRWFAALDSDYGICCNEQSPNDGRITFEHGGCIQHSFIQHLLQKGE